MNRQILKRPVGKNRLDSFGWLSIFIFIFMACPAFAQDQAKKLVALLDYLGSDYKNAVKDGKVLSADEYGEMQEFSKRSLELFKQLRETDKADKAGIEPTIKSLASQIDNKGDPNTVSELARSAKDKLIAAYKIIPYPRQLPTLASGKKIYDENCAQCHGETGKGDGPGRESMNPKTPPPANFTDADFMTGLSPFKVYNTTTFGIDNTAMASFAALPDEQRWQVAFYVLALRFPAETAAAGEAWLKGKSLPADLLSVATLATSSDEELSGKIKKNFPDAPISEILAYLRRGLLEKKASDPLLIARNLLSEAAELYSKGEKEKAYQKAVDAYLDGFELAEPTLKAKDSNLGGHIESLFGQLRNAIRQGASAEAIQKQHLELEVKLDQAAQALARDDGWSGYYAFVNSALIIFREGLEASLILAAIIAMLRVMGATEVIRYIHLGWILALVAGGLTWLATETVLTLSGRHRESMEGFISVFAAVALFYVGYWLHIRSEARRWREFIEQRVKASISTRRIFGLTGISFFAVYREAFEVVLFYQALWMQNESNHGPVLWGLAAGLALLILASVAILKLGLRLPLRYFFGATGTLLYLMAFIFAGNGIKELQVAQWVPTTPLDAPTAIPMLGIYPTVETLAAQGAMITAFVATSFWLGRQRKKAG